MKLGFQFVRHLLQCAFQRLAYEARIRSETSGINLICWKRITIMFLSSIAVLIRVLYANHFRCSHKKIYHGFKSGLRGGRATGGASRLTHCPRKRLFKNCLTLFEICTGAPSHEPHLLYMNQRYIIHHIIKCVGKKFVLCFSIQSVT